MSSRIIHGRICFISIFITGIPARAARTLHVSREDDEGAAKMKTREEERFLFRECG